MFGIGFFEFIVIAIVAVIFLGPDKLPSAMIKIIKTFKTFSKSINEARTAIEKELNIDELKEDSKKYRALLEQNTQKIKKTISQDELSVLQQSAEEVNSALDDIKKAGQNSLDDIKEDDTKSATTNTLENKN
ncbi:MAG: Sec-independent protein translocase protein TatB [Campylobacteraceae bacterium]|nr:Sec-independent protein translocase protein TatB [Campylobacteraceae bacterium]